MNDTHRLIEGREGVKSDETPGRTKIETCENVEKLRLVMSNRRLSTWIIAEDLTLHRETVSEKNFCIVIFRPIWTFLTE